MTNKNDRLNQIISEFFSQHPTELDGNEPDEKSLQNPMGNTAGGSEENDADDDIDAGEAPFAPEELYENALEQLNAASRSFDRAGQQFQRSRKKLASIPVPWIAPFLRLIFVVLALATILMFNREGGPPNTYVGEALLHPDIWMAPLSIAVLSMILGEYAGKSLMAWLEASGFLASLGKMIQVAVTIMAGLALFFLATILDNKHGTGFVFWLALAEYLAAFVFLPWIGSQQIDPKAVFKAMQKANEQQKKSHEVAEKAVTLLDNIHNARKAAAAPKFGRNR